MGSCVHCTHWLRLLNSPPPPRIWAHIRIRALLVSLDRRHLFVIAWLKRQCHENFVSVSWICFPLAPEYPISTVANLQPVSTTPVANCYRYQRHRRQFCHWHRWQIMETISDSRHLQVNLKAKIYIYVNSTTQRCPNKIIRIFLIEDFFHLPWATISANFRKNSKRPLWYTQGLGGNWFMKKTRSRKSRSSVPLRVEKWQVGAEHCRDGLAEKG